MAKLRPVQLIGLAAILVPAAYLGGRYASTISLSDSGQAIASGFMVGALGALIGIPIGLFFGSAKNPSPAPIIHKHPDMTKQQDKLLVQIKDELVQNQNLFAARKGNQTFLTRISYLTGFWTAAKASGQLFVMQEPKLLNTLATAYYWIEQANHLENLAYESQYSSTTPVDNQSATTHLIAEVRLLDAPLEMALRAAIGAIETQLKLDQQKAAFPAPYGRSGA